VERQKEIRMENWREISIGDPGEVPGAAHVTEARGHKRRGENGGRKKQRSREAIEYVEETKRGRDGVY
jgi:hypothetical protein